jgi:sugar phosphate isomerase/epimerase
MYLTGFADEANENIDAQIRITKQLGWTNIEARNVQVNGFDADNIHNIPEAAFEKAAEKLKENEININCFGSTIANWGKKIDEPFSSSLEEIERAIPRMKKLNTKLIRIMSFAVRDNEDQMEQERFKRLREIQKRFSDEGITPVHENCMNYGGMGWTYTLKLIENVPGLKLVFDTGNPVSADDRTKSKPYPKQSSWEFYKNVKQHIAYVHIKDGYYDEKQQKTVHTYPGEGSGDIPRIIKDLLDNGYDGGFSMEPHMATVYHDSNNHRAANSEEIYLEYGRRFMKILETIN